MREKKSFRAFTLIELLVVIAIIGILSTIMLFSMNSHRALKEVEGAGLQVSAKVREAQTAALTGQQYTPGTTPCAYRISWGGSQVTRSYVSKDGSGNCTVLTTIDTLALTGGVAFTSVGSVDFTLPHGQISSNQSLTLQKNGSSQAVCIRTNGLIDTKPTASSC